ncbi:Putative Zinc finger, CCCH-type [Septoria linicola]|uniref:Zinc finger, CCCH-type n=1 Tax=Septoria linicola TaxID=215465 RepID=A0A9Q9AEU8_9PEZI|nr:putative Zinc finger, CCCH-type [Septoria linicola]USW47810.1 Putative Zinc finger, CCCH-type [Septoria linicola]
MSGFRFPPPPPPPPAPAATHPQVGPYTQSGPRGRGRGRQNGPGTIEQNARGTNSNTPSGLHYGTSHSASHARRDHTSDFRDQSHASNQTWRPGRVDTSKPARSDGSAIFSAGAIPPGSYVNPAFAQATAWHSNLAFAPGSGPHTGSPQVGGQDNGSVRNAHARNRQVGKPVEQTSDHARNRTGAQPHIGYKRKFHALQAAGRPSQSGAHEDVLSNPVVPSFGSSIVPEKHPHIPKSSQSTTGRPQIPDKGHANMLGLTPRDVNPGYSSSDSDEDEAIADEETILANGLGPQLTFHDVNGEMRSLNSAADLLAWRKARQNNFPSREHVSAKDAEKRRLGAIRHRLLNEAKDALHNAVCRLLTSSAGSSSANNRVEQARPANANLPQHSVEALSLGSRQELTQVKTREEQLPRNNSTSMPQGDECRSALRHVETFPEAQRSVVTASALESDHDDDPPEETTIKRRPKHETAQTTCRYFAASGYCRDGSACRFKHELPAPIRGGNKQVTAEKQRRDPYAPVLDAPEADGKKSIHQRLLEREQEGEGQLALQVIKYLGSVGFFVTE